LDELLRVMHSLGWLPGPWLCLVFSVT